MTEILKTEDFNDGIKGGVTIVDFFATWCQPCKMLSPVLEELSEDFKDLVKFIKVDTDKFMEIANNYSVVNLPTLVIFKDGVEVEKIIGFNPKETIKNKLEQYI